MPDLLYISAVIRSPDTAPLYEKVALPPDGTVMLVGETLKLPLSISSYIVSFDAFDVDSEDPAVADGAVGLRLAIVMDGLAVAVAPLAGDVRMTDARFKFNAHRTAPELVLLLL